MDQAEAGRTILRVGLPIGVPRAVPNARILRCDRMPPIRKFTLRTRDKTVSQSEIDRLDCARSAMTKIALDENRGQFRPASPAICVLDIAA